MATRRRFSRDIRKSKLARREELEASLCGAVEKLLKEHDPTISAVASRTASMLSAIIASQIAVQTQAAQRALKVLEDDIPEYATDFVNDLIETATRSVDKKLKRFRAAVPPSTHLKALQLPDDWAGPVAGPTIIERHYGIPRSTLYRWQKLNQVISLNSRTSSKPVFPLRQFVDGRPTEGIASLVSIFGDQRLAWSWLVSSQNEFNGRAPLDLLLEGQLSEVMEAARRASPSATGKNRST